MESDSGVDREVPVGADELPLEADNPTDTGVDDSVNDVIGHDTEQIEESGTNGQAATSSCSALDLDPANEQASADEEHPDEDQAIAEPEEMDIDDTTPGLGADESSYIGDNCLSTPAATEDNSPQDEGQLEAMMKDPVLDDADGHGLSQEESPDQSISSAMPIDSGVSEGDHMPIVQDDESSTMDEDIGGGGEGVASSDDINDISSAAQEALNTGISSSTAETGDITSSEQAEASLISSTANGPAILHSFTLTPQQDPINEFGDADTSEMEGPADTMPSVNESLPLLTMTANGAALLSPNLLQGEEGGGGGVSSSVAGAGAEQSAEEAAAVAAVAVKLEGEGAVSSSGAVSLPPADAAHALATLASAALHHQQEQAEAEEQKQQNDEDVWYTVGIVKGNSFTVQNYITDPNVDISSLSLDNLPDLTGLPTTALEHGTAYKFRIAAVNSCGKGEYSEESAFKTCLPGFPGAPSAIKISKSVEGAHLSWEPPQVAAEGIFEYSVYLAVRSNTPQKEASKSQLAFVRVYCGKANQCVVAQASLGAAHVDSSTKPAIIFRIAARNDKGYGPATQVRWLQDIKSAGVKRAGEGRVPGASPSKQPKQLLH